ncbi:hypothetical protein SAMN04487939_10589 [Lysobacter sp. yr284]|uniref:hypothetical protein n=1 Tax=Lysobacter TaxID=68 RepID=UPI00089C52A4|nr:hypothetical protein [Lysobacter sp. yr284]SDY70360.1 hypothetical protein SAMN04487939_10589 [Lysobacter sp. yr284]
MYAVAVRWSEHYIVEPRRTSHDGAGFVASTEPRGTLAAAPATIAPAVRMEREPRAGAHERADKNAPPPSRRAPFGLQLRASRAAFARAAFAGAGA